MKKLLIGCFVLIAGFLYFSRNPVAEKRVQIDQISSVAASPASVPTSQPVRLKIPTLGIDTEIEEVGMDPDGRMGVPSSADTTGWWKLGVQPGEEGSAVIAGHFDSPTGEPGVFYDLHTLVPGDEIIVVGQNNISMKFLITGQEIFLDSAFPLDRVFATGGGRYLNLITCSGTFDKSVKNYEKRLVVFAKLVEE